MEKEKTRINNEYENFSYCFFNEIYSSLISFFNKNYDFESFPPFFVDIDRLDKDNRTVSFNNGNPAVRLYINSSIRVYDKKSWDIAQNFLDYYNENIRKKDSPKLSLDRKF